MQYPNLVQTKTSQNQVTHIEWNPGMDLLATVFCNSALTCSRLLSFQKVWHKQPEGAIEGIAWRPDGRVLAIGAYNNKTKEYTCTLHDVENGQELNTIKVDKPITSVSWFQLTDEDKDKEDDNKLKKPPNNPIKEQSDTFSHQLAHKQTQLNILYIATDHCKISFYSLGLFYIGEISIPADGLSKIIKTHSSSCLRYITALIQTKHNTSTELTLKVFNLNTFHDRSKEILEVSKMYAKVTDELEYLDDTMNAITTSWADVLAGLDNKLSSYCSRKSRKPDESLSGYTFLSADELLQLLVIGFTSDNLEKFLADMSDKGLKKLNNAIEQTCLRIQNLIVKNAQKCCYHLHGDLNTLRGLATESDHRYRDVGLDDKFIVDAMRSVGALMLKLTELQQVIDHSLKSSKSFFRWLISIACRMTNEQNNSMVPNDINKTTQQDIQLITDFILENFDYNHDDLDEPSTSADQNDSTDRDMTRPTCSNFTLEQIGQYLKDESLTRFKYSFSKPGSNFWIEFFKQRPELIETRISDRDGSSILVFYPHNQDTSLIQEYKNTRLSIRSAFESVASNMKKVLEGNGTVFQFSNSLKNSPGSRVRIETDTKRMYHHTLFQTKPGPTLRHYLLSHSLNDKHFILVSMEFTSLGEKYASTSRSGAPMYNYQLVIADSNFYENKETRNILLSFLLLDRNTDDTLIVQVDLNKIMQLSNGGERGPIGHHCGDISKVFKSKICTVDHHACHVALTLDLHSDPPSERKHNADMMVKKIKKTVGQDMFLSSGRGVIAFTSCLGKRLHLYELESLADGSEIQDDEAECDERLDESLIDNDLVV